MSEIDLTDKIAEAIDGPASVSVDGQSVTQHNLAEIIAADRYLASKEITRKGKLGIRIFKCVRGGYNE